MQIFRAPKQETSFRGPAVSEAKKHLKDHLYQCRLQISAFYKEAEAIEDPDLKWGVAILLHALVVGCAAFKLRTQTLTQKVHLTLPHIEVDEDVVDLVEGVLGAPDSWEAAGSWVLRALQGSSATLIAWAFDSFTCDAGEHHQVTSNRVVFDTKTKKIAGVLEKGRETVLIPVSKLVTSYPTGRDRVPDWVYTCERYQDQNQVAGQVAHADPFE